MRPSEIRFGGFQWHHNPKKLTVDCQKNTAEHKVPFGNDALDVLGERLRSISGEGELYGSDCLEQYGALKALYLSKKRAVLSLPQMPSMYAVFTELVLLCEPVDNVVTYRFAFREVSGAPRATDAERVYVTQTEENLWDIAYRFDTDIETLAALNPWLRTIDRIEQGRSVRLC